MNLLKNPGILGNRLDDFATLRKTKFCNEKFPFIPCQYGNHVKCKRKGKYSIPIT